MDNYARGRVRADLKIKINIQFKDKNKVLENCLSENISINGVLVKNDEQVTIGDLCKINIILQSNEENKIEIKVDGKVSRITDDGFAINFSNIDNDSLLHLKNIVKHNTEDLDEFIEECKARPGFK